MFNKNTNNWLKAIFFVSLLFAANYAMATDSMSITELNQTTQDVKSSGNVVAGVGGFIVIVLAGLIIGFGRNKAEIAGLLTGLFIMTGVIAYGYGTYKSRISEGFDFSTHNHVMTVQAGKHVNSGSASYAR
jgi:ABC-type antimicrobial peptide transport system permease subunit